MNHESNHETEQLTSSMQHTGESLGIEQEYQPTANPEDVTLPQHRTPAEFMIQRDFERLTRGVTNPQILKIAHGLAEWSYYRRSK